MNIYKVIQLEQVLVVFLLLFFILHKEAKKQ